MPILSMFYGIVAYMYFYDTQEHHLYKMKLVQAWLEIHRDEIMADWSLAVRGIPIEKIKPLE